MKTKITELFGIQHPILLSGMSWISTPELVAAVSEAGGLGVLTALTFETAEGLADAIARTRALTDKPFGVNLTFLPTVTAPDYEGYIRAIIDGGSRVFVAGLGVPRDVIDAFHDEMEQMLADR